MTTKILTINSGYPGHFIYAESSVDILLDILLIMHRYLWLTKFTFVFGFSGDSDNFLGKISAIIDNLFVDGSDHLQGAPGFNDTAHSHGPGPLRLDRVTHSVTRVSANRRNLSLRAEKQIQ